MRNCVSLIFSKDRALQLDATLRSFLLYCKDPELSEIRVLYTTTTSLHEEQYRQLQKHPYAIGFSLRLGKNTTYCYPLDKGQRLPEFQTIEQDILKYNWTNAEY